ncbi:MAG TPA: hypothetical protein VJO35_01685 [Terriglobales bacterium]|nr:hypothetical protein [Terriglobales bacterium]
MGGQRLCNGIKVPRPWRSRILSIYPVLEHKRSLSHQATLLHFAEVNGIRRLDQISDSDVQELLLGLASQLSTHRNELTLRS